MVDRPENLLDGGRARRRERDLRAWQLRAERKSLSEIRQILIDEDFGDYKETTISACIKRIDDENRNGMHETIATYRMRMVHLKEFIIKESLDAWEKSKNPAVSKKIKGRLNTPVKKFDDNGEEIPPDYDPVESRERTKSIVNRDGDPRYLGVAMQAGAEISKLLGLYEPKRMNVAIDNADTMKLKEKIDKEIEGLDVDSLRKLVEVANEIVSIKEDAKAVDVEFRQLPNENA